MSQDETRIPWKYTNDAASVVLEFVKLLHRRNAVNQMVNENESRDVSNPRPPKIFTSELDHTCIMSILYDNAMVEKRIKQGNKEREELNFAIENITKRLSQLLVPNHWYVFDRVAIINVFWITPQGSFRNRVEWEEFDNKAEYIEFNGRNLEPCENFGDGTPIPLDTWFEKIAYK